MNLTPSSLACLISSKRAGSSFSVRLYSIETSSKPTLTAVLAASIATFPPPIIAAFLPILRGVAQSPLPAPMRLTRVRNSFAENTPFKFSPGILIILGSPAPEQINIASNPSSFNCFKVTDLPTITFVLKSTPIDLRFVISLSRIVLGSLNGGIP